MTNGFDWYVKKALWARGQSKQFWYKWGNFCRMRDGQDDDLARVFPHKTVNILTYGGPTVGNFWEEARVYPTDKLVLVLLALWPKTYQDMAKKYMRVYSDGYVEKREVKPKS